jgi:hypothetical protein
VSKLNSRELRELTKARVPSAGTLDTVQMYAVVVLGVLRWGHAHLDAVHGPGPPAPDALRSRALSRHRTRAISQTTRMRTRARTIRP